MRSTFDRLRAKLGSHKAAASYLRVSYTRYNEWRWRPEIVPPQGRRLMELALFRLEHRPKR
jgi:hypothetical protein